MQEEIGLWKEDSIKVKVLLWDKQKNPSIPPEVPKTDSPSDPPKDPIPPINIPNPGKEIIISRITNFNQGEKVLKGKIVQLLEDYPNLASYFAKYFN